MLNEAGMAVLREIPKEFLGNGYTAYGGVIRDAAGKIVAHLAMPASELGMPALSAMMGGPTAIVSSAVSAVSGLVANAQLVSLSKDVQQVLQVTMAGTALAGLGVATSMVGFWYLNRRVAAVEDKLQDLKVEVEKIRRILEVAQKAKLLAAIKAYKLACSNSNEGQKERLLLGARDSFEELTFFYKDMAQEPKALEELEVAEGFFVAACLGNAVCTSDLGMYAQAAENFREHYTDWQTLARKHCVDLLDLEHPTRLLDGCYVNDLPASELVRVLDFARDDRRGIQWIDELRKRLGVVKWPDFTEVYRPKVGFAKALCARNEVLGSYVEHFRVLGELAVPVTEYARQLMDMTKDGHAVLNILPEPVKA